MVFIVLFLEDGVRKGLLIVRNLFGVDRRCFIDFDVWVLVLG